MCDPEESEKVLERLECIEISCYVPENSKDSNENGEEVILRISARTIMSKRKSECEDYPVQMMSDTDESRLPTTPIHGKRRRGYTSDVIDSMGESPASSYSCTASCSTPSSAGYVTPQRSGAYWNSPITPNQGYSTTPELRRSAVPDWIYQRVDTQDAFVPDAFADNFLFSSIEPTGKMSVHKDSDRYNMDHEYRGKCVIFNHENFDTGFDPRKGSNTDVLRIEQTFQRLGFTVEICEDYEYKSIMTKINEVSEEDHTNNDCLCIFVLTHGLKNDFLCAKDVAYKPDNLWKPFTADRCLTLAGKPKLFFFQACRGDNFDKGVRMYRSGVTDTDAPVASYIIPTHADFLLAYSTMQGFFSWRNPEEGTWYIQSLCDVIDEYADTTDLVKMLTIVARKVALDYASYNNIDPSMHNQKQVPVVTSVLLRDLYFTPKNQ